MKFCFFGALLGTALVVVCAPANSQLKGGLPPPPVLQKFEQTMSAMKTLSVVVTVSKKGETVDQATLYFVSPNKVRITSLVNKEREVFLSDGKMVTEWNATQYSVDPSAADFADLNSDLGFDSVSGEMAESAFLSPKDFAEIPEFVEIGPRYLNGKIVDTMTATTFHGTKILTCDSATGLPLEEDYMGKGIGFTVKYSGYKLNQSISPSAFEASLPPRLTKYVVAKEPPLLPNGVPAPDFTLQTPSGENVSLSSYKGKVVLIDFWASWCPPCKMSMPHIQHIYSDLQSKGLNVLSVNTWDSAQFANAFIAKHPWYTTTFVIDSNPNFNQSVAVAKYKVFGIPTAYLIDQNGNIAASFVDYEPNMEIKIRNAIAKLGISPG